MTRNEWYRQYSIWRRYKSSFRSIPPTAGGGYAYQDEDIWKEAHKIHFNTFYDMAPLSIRNAILGQSTVCVRSPSEGKWALKCNLDLSQEQCETKRLKDRGVNVLKDVLMKGITAKQYRFAVEDE